MLNSPRIVALCGYPKSGKDTVADLLVKHFDFVKIDDGYALRDFAMRHLGLSHDDVYTQEGKTRYSEINGQPWQHRDVLGSFGNKLEALFGDDIMPWMATRNLDHYKRYVFPSCRKQQAWFYKRMGGVVIEVQRPGFNWSGYDFDKYEKTALDHTFINDASLDDLERSVVTFFEHFYVGFDVVA